MSCSARATTARPTSSQPRRVARGRGLDAATSSARRPRSIGGGGGGRPTMARAGGKDPDELADALARPSSRRRGARREGARARLRLGADRRRRLRSDGHARAAARRRRARGDRGGLATRRACRARRRPERIVVGLPLTLRGEHGAQADETARSSRRSEGARRPGRDVRRAVHDRSPRRRRRTRRRTRVPPPTC